MHQNVLRLSTKQRSMAKHPNIQGNGVQIPVQNECIIPDDMKALHETKRDFTQAHLYRSIFLLEMEKRIMRTVIADEILGSALKQSDADRARIAEALIASLDVSPELEVDKAWQVEIDKRLREIDSGVVKCVPWEEVRDRLYLNANVQR